MVVLQETFEYSDTEYQGLFHPKLLLNITGKQAIIKPESYKLQGLSKLTEGCLKQLHAQTYIQHATVASTL